MVLNRTKGTPLKPTGLFLNQCQASCGFCPLRKPYFSARAGSVSSRYLSMARWRFAVSAAQSVTICPSTQDTICSLESSCNGRTSPASGTAARGASAWLLFAGPRQAQAKVAATTIETRQYCLRVGMSSPMWAASPMIEERARRVKRTFAHRLSAARRVRDASDSVMAVVSLGVKASRARCNAMRSSVASRAFMTPDGVCGRPNTCPTSCAMARPMRCPS